MGPALPPSPPAIVLSVPASSPTPTQYKIPRSPTSLSAAKTFSPRKNEPKQKNWTTGFNIGPKTKGARDASRHSRANRRKG